MSIKADFEAFLANLRKETGLAALAADESGLVSVRVDDVYNLNLQFVEATGKILCFVEIATLPQDASKAVYRDLLVAGLFGRDTAGGYFAVESETETVVYNYFFDFDKAAADIEEFVSTIEKILQLCDIWAERICRVLSGDEQRDAEHEIEAQVHHFSSMIRA
jgi:hypothetical protein